jgi:SWI/SNF-like complex subunit BAF250/Osa
MFAGIVDIHALTMSLKSEMKLEVSNALNILTVLTSNRSVVLSMRHCDDLLDVLLDYLEQDLMGVNSRYDTQANKEEKLILASEKDQTYSQLFEMSLDEMKSLIPSLEKTTSDVWLSYRERCLCIINILRNLSFMPENQEYFGRHKRLTDILAYVLASDISMEEDASVRKKHQDDNTMIQTNGNDHLDSDRPAWYVGIRHMDTLDYRKSALLIFSNIVVFLKLASASSALIFIKLTNDFLSNGPDTYFSQIAVETWAKVSVSYDNRNVFAALSLTSAIENKNTDVVQHEDAFTYLENIWEELGSIIRKDFFTSDGRVLANMKAHQLALLEMAVMGLYNIMVIAKDESLRARLLVRDRGIAMVVVKLCVSLAEYGTQHFSVVCRRGLELVRGLITGGDGLRRKTEDNRLRDNPENPETSPQLGTEVTSRIASKLELDAYVINQLLMHAMLNPATDPDTTRELWDIQSLLEEES